jgi:predicted pPIWI-associating nuclease
MSDDLNPSDKEEGSQGLPSKPVAKQPRTYPNIVSKALNNILADSNFLQRYMEENQRVFAQILKAAEVYESVNLRAILEVLKIIETQDRLVDFDKILHSPAFEITAVANDSISRLLTMDATNINKLLKHSISQSEIWREQMLAVDRVVESMREHDVIWRTHFAEISKFSTLSQAMVSQIPWDQIGNAIDIRDKIGSNLRSSFLEFSQSYSGLFASFEKQPSIILSIPPVISKLPSVEFFNRVNLVDEITVDVIEDTEFEAEKHLAIDETRQETRDRLEALLADFNADLITPLQGARESLNSTNPDRIRHFATSLRELFTHVMHSLAPDDKVREWSKAPEHFSNGKPTRKARLLYISRELHHEPFSTFVEKDVDAVVAFLQLFQQGTHEINSSFTDPQPRIMLFRIESTLRFLLEIWQANL